MIQRNLTEFKGKDKRDTVELEFIQLGKRLNVLGDEGEGEVKEPASLTHKDLDNGSACGRQEKSGVEAVWEGS